jgi:hypothetical protein
MELKIKVIKLTGVTPLLMHSAAGVDPKNPLVIEKESLTSKKKNKTQADRERIDYLDWLLGLYLDPEGRIIVPGANIDGMLYAAGKKRSKGPKFLAGVSCEDALLDYKGPRDIDKMYADPQFHRRGPVTIKKAKIIRMWPRFFPWAVTATLTYDPEIIGWNEIMSAFDTGVKQIGFMDLRPKFGKFLWEEVD